MPARQASGYCILVPPRPQAHCKHEKYNGRGCQPFSEQVVYHHAVFSRIGPNKLPLSVILSNGRTPDRAFFFTHIPAEDDEDRFAIERVFAKKMAYAVLVERTDDGRIDLSRVARDPVETPKSCLRVE